MGGQYGDAALPVYIKIAALAMRPERCRAEVLTLARYLGLSKSAVERALTQLNGSGADGLAEVITHRRTSRDGEGESAERYVREMDEDELFVWIPARAATALTPRQLRLYAAIAYAQARRIPLALQDLQDVVRHQYGASAGEPLGARQVMRLLTATEESGWITVHRRQGPRGRHIYEAHRRPLHVVPDPAVPTDVPVQEALFEPAAPLDTHDGSAPRTADGSPSKDDNRTDRPGRDGALGGGIRRRRPAGSRQGRPVDNSVPGTFRAAGHDHKRSSTGPEHPQHHGALTRRAWQVLEPVRHLLTEVRPFVLRRIDAEIGRQLAQGTGMERLTARLTARYATTDTIRDPGRWVLGAALVRHGCGLDACESGRLWHTGQACQVCLDISLTTPAAIDEPPPAAGPPPDPPADTQRWLPWPPPPPADRPPPANGTDDVRQVLAEHGAAEAIRIFGRTHVLPHLTPTGETSGTE